MIEIKSYQQVQALYIFLRKQRENQRFLKYCEIGATFLLISFFILFAIKPTVTTISSLWGEIKAKQELSVQMRKKIANIVMAQNSYSQLQGKYELIESSLPDKPRYYQAASQVSGSIAPSSMTIDKIGFSLTDSNDKKIKDSAQYGVSVNGSGYFTSIFEFLDNLFDGRRVMDLSDVKINKSDSRDKNISGQTLEIIVNSKAFYWNKDNEKN